MEKQKDKRLDTPLAKAFDFTHGDLESNRAGFISYRQKRRMWRSYWFSDFLVFGGLGIGTLIFIIPPIILNIISNSSDNHGVSWLINFGLLIFFGIISLTGILYAWIEYTTLKGEFKNGRLAILHTSIEDKRVKRGKHTFYEVGINNCSYLVSHKQYNLLDEDTPYTFYVTPTSKKILSVELISPEDIQ